MIRQINRLPVLTFLFTLTLLMGRIHAAWEMPPESFAPAMGQSISIASDADGNAIVVLDDSFDSATVQAFFYSRATNTWTGPTTLGNIIGSAFVLVDMDAGGHALAIWQNNSSTEIHSSFFNGSTWTTGSPDPFATPGGISTFNLDMNGPNTGLAVWIDSGTNQAVSSFFVAGIWSPIPIPIAPSDSIQSSAAYSSNGTAVAGFVNGAALQVSNYIGGVWLSPVTLDPATPFTGHNIVLGIDSAGKALAVYVDAAGDVKSRTFDGISNWSAAVTISITPANDSFSTSISMAPNGTAVATWIDGAGVGWSNSYNGTTWGTPQQFSSSARDAEVSVNIHGNALVVYSTSDDEVFSARLPLGGVWTAPEFIFDGTPLPVNALDSSLSNSEFGFAAWGIGVEGLDFFAAVERILPPAPPTSINGSSCSDRFATQTDLVNIITFIPSPSPTVAAYYLRRNGVLIAVIPATGPYIYFDHNRSKKIVDVYTLTAVNANGAESTPVVVVL